MKPLNNCFSTINPLASAGKYVAELEALQRCRLDSKIATLQVEIAKLRQGEEILPALILDHRRRLQSVSPVVPPGETTLGISLILYA